MNWSATWPPNWPITWNAMWDHIFGLPPDTPQWAVAVVALASVHLVAILPSAAAFLYIERKMAADFEARIGPNRAGPSGMLQSLADLLKLLQKESPTQWRWRDTVNFSVRVALLYSMVALIPIGSVTLMVDTDVSALLPLSIALAVAFWGMFLAVGQDLVPAWLGGIRLGAQAMAGMVPALISLFCVTLNTGGFHWSSFANEQGALPLSWNFLSSPFNFVASMLFVASGLVLFGLAPLDCGVTAQGHRGLSSSYCGRHLALYRYGTFYSFFLWSVFSVVVFFGAWVLPGPLQNWLKDGQRTLLLQILELTWLLTKAFVVMFLVVWITKTNPRLRADQATDFAWRILTPCSLAALIGAAAMMGWRAFV